MNIADPPQYLWSKTCLSSVDESRSEITKFPIKSCNFSLKPISTLVAKGRSLCPSCPNFKCWSLDLRDKWDFHENIIMAQKRVYIYMYIIYIYGLDFMGYERNMNMMIYAASWKLKYEK